MTTGRGRALRIAVAVLAAVVASVAAAQQTLLVTQGSACAYLANSSNPGGALQWTNETFDDSAWPRGNYGVGYEDATGAAALLATTVPVGTLSVYTRATFDVPSAAAVRNLFLGCDYDDGYVAWLNGTEIYRSAEMPAGAPTWNATPTSHESSNGTTPAYGILRDVSAVALPLLHDGTNVLAIGAWNVSDTSSDFVLAPELIANLPLSVVRGPYLQIGTPASIVVRWRTSEACVGRVAIGSAPGSLTTTFDETLPTTEHVVQVSGLSPSTRYSYSVGTPIQVLAGDDAGHWFVTAPPAGTRPRFRAWVIGDSGTKNRDARHVRDAFYGYNGSVHPDLWLMLGDNAYDAGTDDDYQGAVFEMYRQTLATSVLWPTIGNHDALAADSTTQTGVYYDNFTLPTAAEAGGLPSGTEAYWSFDWANVHFICLDSQDLDRSPTGAMATWLQQDLAATTQDFIVAYFHHPCYTKGTHDSDTEVRHVEMRQWILPILEQGGVDLVLGGHSHSYERSWLIDGHYGLSNTFGPANLVDGGDGKIAGDGAYRKAGPGPAPHEGEVHVVAGSSGQIEAGFGLDHPAMYFSMLVLGSVVLDVDGCRLDATFIDDTGATIDSFTITKGCPSTETSCTNGVDDDVDGLVDCRDPDCATVDADSDGTRDCSDCAPADPGAFAAPQEIARLDVTKVLGSRTDAEIAWDDPRALTGTATVSDVATGGIRALWADRGFANAGCLARDVAGVSAQDPRRTGAASDGFWYLVRGRNACASGTWGWDSTPTERVLPTAACN